MANKQRRTRITILVLIILLFLSLGYIGFNFYSNWKIQKDNVLFTQAAQYGYTQAISQLFNQVQTCKQIPILFNNQTINVIAVECLQQQTQAQTETQA